MADKWRERWKTWDDFHKHNWGTTPGGLWSIRNTDNTGDDPYHQYIYFTNAEQLFCNARPAKPEPKVGVELCLFEGGPLDGLYFMIENESVACYFPKGGMTEQGGVLYDEPRPGQHNYAYRRTGPKRFSYSNSEEQTALEFLMFDIMDKIKSGSAPDCWD